ncbi:uncharacterized protein LOC127870854 [Dreissena polymorpha]|uniref:Poly [ADP-ribose] polymerase n=1 Tax=Dreissena polymorpha TaxID=45954 RepID=A0A9D4LAC3_DREPO|nr:uncharacterized protein LOC127870854 [Dreissena polymorpha]XP_052269351.1 uncharacterized protein LOC127870854 [Dreissena polymorpha]KAH3854915.1 hypothetical protein DPMN_097476 [Dreissena polymorpha]
MATLKGSVLATLCGAIIGAIIGLRPLLNVTLDMFVQEVVNECVEVTIKHGNFRNASIDNVCRTVNITQKSNETFSNINGTCALINCTSNVHVDYPKIAIFIEWNNILSACLYFFVCLAIIVKKGRGDVLISLLSFVEMCMFSNYVLFATLVGSAVGFTPRNLTVSFYVCATISAIVMASIISTAVSCIACKDSLPPSNLVGIRYKKVIRNDPERCAIKSKTCTDVTIGSKDSTAILVTKIAVAERQSNDNGNEKRVVDYHFHVKGNEFTEANTVENSSTKFKDNVVVNDDGEIAFINENDFVKKQVNTKGDSGAKDDVLCNDKTDVIDQIKSKIYSQWAKDEQNVGIGRDAKGLSHSTIQILNVITVYSDYLLDRYNTRRNRLVAFVASVGGRLKPLSEYPGIGKDSGLKPTPSDFGKSFVNHSLNEYYLYHGTTPSTAKLIAEEGFDVQKCRRTMLGRGLYFADSVVKADQYTTPDENGMCCIIVAKVLIGDFCVSFNRQNIPPSSQQPPCKKCMKIECSKKHKTEGPRFDSVVFIGGLFREYVVFDNCQAYPEYIIYYKRV